MQYICIVQYSRQYSTTLSVFLGISVLNKERLWLVLFYDTLGIMKQQIFREDACSSLYFLFVQYLPALNSHQCFLLGHLLFFNEKTCFTVIWNDNQMTPGPLSLNSAPMQINGRALNDLLRYELGALQSIFSLRRSFKWENPESLPW